MESKCPYREFRTLQILTVSMFKHVQTRIQLLITHMFDASRKRFMPINLIAARRQAY